MQKLADGAAFVAADRISCVNSVYSFVKQVNVDFNGVMVNDVPNINLCAHIKNLLEYTEPHQNILSNSFYFLDKHIDPLLLTYPDFASIKTAGFEESAYKIRHDKIIALQTNNVLLNLNQIWIF